MPLQNVTETYQVDTAPRPPKNKPVFDLAPPVDLTDPTVFSSRGGYTHEAFAEMREKAPVMWHPEEHGAGFWAVTPYELVKQVELDPATFSSGRHAPPSAATLIQPEQPDQSRPSLPYDTPYGTYAILPARIRGGVAQTR